MLKSSSCYMGGASIETTPAGRNQPSPRDPVHTEPEVHYENRIPTG